MKIDELPVIARRQPPVSRTAGDEPVLKASVRLSAGDEPAPLALKAPVMGVRFARPEGREEKSDAREVSCLLRCSRCGDGR